MKKTDTKDSKLNTRLYGTVRGGARRIVSGAGSIARRLRLWQKIGLLICLVFWIASYVIRIVCGRIVGGMEDQSFASRWSQEQECSQVSAFLSDSAFASDETVEAMRMFLTNKLTSDSYGLSEQQIENGASMFDVSYCGLGMADLSTPEDSVTVTAIGVGGDFFNFHPLELMSGYYFSEDESMQDRILLDDRTAWRLFGSPYIVGESVEIGGTPHYIAGVFRAPSKRFYKQSGMGDFLVYISFDSLCKYTQRGTPSNEGNPEDMDDSMMDALAPGMEKTASALMKGGETGKEAFPPSAFSSFPGEVLQQKGFPGEVLQRTALRGTGIPFRSADSGKPAENAVMKMLPPQNLPSESDERMALVRNRSLPALRPDALWKPDAEPDSGAGEHPLVSAEAVGGEPAALLPHEQKKEGKILAFDSVDDLGADDFAEEGGDDAGEADPAGGNNDSGESSDTDTKPEDDDRITNDDTPVGENMNSGGMGNSYDRGNGDAEPKPEVNKSRISCYEAVLPNPITNYALNTMISCLTEAGVDNSQTVIVDNTARFDTWRLALMIAQPGLRSMQSISIRYPYWENVARAWEDIMIPFAFLELFMRFSPFLFLLFLLLWYATHRSWTMGGVIQNFREKIYDRQSEKIFGSDPDEDALLTGGNGQAEETLLPGEAPGSGEDADLSDHTDVPEDMESVPESREAGEGDAPEGGETAPESREAGKEDVPESGEADSGPGEAGKAEAPEGGKSGHETRKTEKSDAFEDGNSASEKSPS